MQKIKNRNEIPEELKWDLTTIYKTDEDFYKDIENAKKIIDEMYSYKGKIFKTKNNLIKYLKNDENLSLLLNKILTYGIRKHDEDTTNSKYQEMYQVVENIYNVAGEKTSSFRPEFLKVDKKTINEYLKDKYLSKYKKIFDDLSRYKEHTLTDNEEEMLSKLALTFSASENTFSMLNDADIKFPTIIDEEGNEVELTNSNYSLFIHSTNRRVREDAFKKFHNKYASLKNTLASTFLGHVNTNIALSKIKKYISVRESLLFIDKIPISVYDNLISTVKSRKDVINNYFSLIKEELNLEELHRYDIYADFTKESNNKYTVNEAKNIIFDALSVLGNDYKSKLSRAFDERWIDFMPNKGKRGGAYSSGGYGTNAFILTSFEGRYNDVSTLAHELGHSMHTTYSCENQDIIYSKYRIFVAEVASTTNELLLAKYMLKNSSSKEEKLSILQNLLNLYYATLLRQTMFCEFERDIYDLREKDIPVTHETLENKYFDLCKDYFGDNVVLDEELKYEWSRIPHFYYNFYVYKYATSLAASNYISSHILADKSYRDKYIKFLSSGSSLDPLDELKIVDVDLNDSNVINEAMDEFNSYIDEYRKLKNS